MTEDNITPTEKPSSPVKQGTPSKKAPAKAKVATKKTSIVSPKKTTKEITKPKLKLKVIRDSFTMPHSDY